MKRVYLALPSSGDMAAAIRERLARKKTAKHVEVVDDLSSAHVVVTSTDDIGTLPARLPLSVELLQLTDCGGGQRYLDAPDLTIANISHVLADGVTTVAMAQIVRAARRVQLQYGVPEIESGMNVYSDLSDEAIDDLAGNRLLQFGLIGLGFIGNELLDHLAGTIALHVGKSLTSPYHLDRIVISDIRTPQQGHLEFLGRRFGELGISVRRVTLDKLLSTSDIVLVAAHHGPTADPLLGGREARLIDSQSWVIDVSEAGVVDRSAFDSEVQGRQMPTYTRIMDAPVDRLAENGIHLKGPPDQTAKFISWNLRQFAKGKPMPTVEHVDFPSAGDPAFWSSRMSPRQNGH